jgi:nucleoside-diphosphate-sugar epimerase
LKPSVLIVGQTSVVGRSIGRELESTHLVSYAGRAGGEVQLDLADPEDINEIAESFDVLVHCAADFGGSSYEEIKQAAQVNVIGALKICELARRAGVSRVVIVSSVSAHYQLGDPHFGIYSLSKRQGDEMAAYYCAKEGLPLTILRPSQIYDTESQCRQHQGLFYSIVDKAEIGEDITFYGSNNALRNLIHLDDFSEIVRLVIEREVDGIFDATAPSSTTLGELANIAYEVFGNGGKAHFNEVYPDVADLPHRDSSELYEIIGHWPSISLIEGIDQISCFRSAT